MLKQYYQPQDYEGLTVENAHRGPTNSDILLTPLTHTTTNIPLQIDTTSIARSTNAAHY